jgi:hypothetical protein
MKNFDALFSQLLKEFNVEDRNDPAFYDYVVIMLQQIRQKGLLNPDKLSDVRETAMEIVRKGYYNFISEENNISQKIEFIFKGGKDSTKKDENQPVNNLMVRISSLPSTPNEKPKVFENTYEESSITDIVDYLETKKVEAQETEKAGTEVPAQTSEEPSALPGGAQEVPDTSQYLKGM